MTASSSLFDRNLIQDVGVGLRSCHFQEIIETKPAIPWFEILTDNYLVEGGPMLYHLEQIRQDYPMVMHSVGMSLGSTDPLNLNYLQQIKKLIQLIDPAYVSDHLCWVSVQEQYLHELLPLPYTAEAAKHVAERIKQVQDILERQILIENVSSYLSYRQSSMPEWEFLSAVSEAADCLILLDINNIYVSAKNHHFNPLDYLRNVPKSRIAQFHLAGFQDCGAYLLDNHGCHVNDAVWQLYNTAIEVLGPVPTLLEWDNDIPNLAELTAEAAKAQAIMDQKQ